MYLGNAGVALLTLRATASQRQLESLVSSDCICNQNNTTNVAT